MIAARGSGWPEGRCAVPFTIGENVGPYRIVEKLGQGGMATVFKAYHPALDRYVAIKVLHPAFQEDPQFLARFQREARIVAKLDHPNIVPIYDFAEHRGHPYLVMRYVEGETLKARLKRGPLSLEEVHHVMRSVGDALAYAHRQGVLHRDIKPSNIILTPEGHVYLTDFGLARMAQAGESTLSRDMMVGTPQYISPEQAKGETNLDARTDVYSLGVVLYELLVGRVPFQADTPYAIIHDHIFTPLPLPRSIKPDLPESLERVLLKALAKDPDDRFQSVEEMVQAFEEAVGTVSTVVAAPPETVVAPRPPEPVPAERGKRKRRWWAWVLIGLAAFLCAVGSLMVMAGLTGKGGRQGILPRLSPGPGTPGPFATPRTTSRPAERWLEEARTARDQGEVVRALMLYRRAIDADPGLEPAYLEAADLLAKTGDVERLLENYLAGVSAVPESLELHQRLAETAALVGATDIVNQEIEWLSEEAPDDPLIPACAGMVAIVETSCETAVPQFEQALRYDPSMPLALYGRGLCELISGEAEKAQADLEEVLYRHRTSPLVQMSAEVWLSVLELGVDGAVQRTVEDLRSLLSHIPPEQEELRTGLTAHVNRAWNEWRAGRTDAAVQELRDARGQLVSQWQDLEERLALDLGRQLARLTFMMNVLTPAAMEPLSPLEQDWETLRALAADVPAEDGLRDAYKETLDHALAAWEEGDVAAANQILKDLIAWAEEHRTTLGDPLTEEIIAAVDRLIEEVKAP